jgi:uncharacterized protein YjbI with pentapeptide repeats
MRSCDVTRRQTPGATRILSPDVPDDLPPHDGDLDTDERLDGVRLSGSWLNESRDGLEIRRSRLAGVRLTGATLDHLVLEDVVATDCELSGATLNGAVLQRVHFQGCRMSGLVAADLAARDVRMTDCVLDGAWFRMASFERCELTGCDLRGADLYGARLRHTRLVHSQLDGTEWSAATAEDVALHHSSLDDVRGIGALRNLVIGSDQLLSVAVPMLATLGIVVDDDYLDHLAAD